jgi:hypothetical protein
MFSTSLKDKVARHVIDGRLSFFEVYYQRKRPLSTSRLFRVKTSQNAVYTEESSSRRAKRTPQYKRPFNAKLLTRSHFEVKKSIVSRPKNTQPNGQHRFRTTRRGDVAQI